VTARPSPSVAQQSVALGDHVHARAQPLSVDTGAIQDDAVTTDKLADDAVTADKLANALFGGTPSAIDPDDTASNGSGQVFALSDHQHAATAGTPDGLTKTATSAENNGSTFARNNHTHATNLLPWGVLPSGVFSSNANDSARAAGVDTDMTVTVALTANRLYKVTLNATAAVGTANVAYAADLEHDGALIGRFWREGNGSTPAGDGPYVISATIDYIPSADDASATLTVLNSAGSGGNLTMQPGANLRTLTVVDCGPV